MNKLFIVITALGLSITYPAIASAKQIVTPKISDNSVNKVIDKERNISEFSLSSTSNKKQLIARSVARLNFSWRIAPTDLAAVAINLIMTAKTPDLAALVLLLLSGQDLYVVRVRIHNTGNVPLRVYPQNIKVYYGNKYTSAIAIPDNRFFQPDILQPNYYIDKPVIFIAPYGLNLIRDVRMGYRDSSIKVIND